MTQRVEYGKFVVEVVSIDRLVHLDKNARFMTAEMLRRLVANIAKDGHLSQLPFCVPMGKDRETCLFRILSGNHRVKAARMAGLTEVPIIYTLDALTDDEQVAIQLSHNAISGQDDPTILRELWDTIGGVDAKLYTGLDDKALREIPPVNLPTISEGRLDFKTLTFLFLPDEQERLESGLAEGRRLVEHSDVYMARLADFDRMLDALEIVSEAYDVKNSATGLLVVFALFEQFKDRLSAGWFDELTGTVRHKGWVPIASIVGTDKMPAEAAAVLKTAVDRLQASGDVTADARWRALELMAAEINGMPDA